MDVVLKNVDGQRSVEVDGHRLKGVRATDVRVAVGELDRVVVEFVMPVVQVDGDAFEVVVEPKVAESLIALGWTPPSETV